MLLERFIEIIVFFADVSNIWFLISGFWKFRGVSENNDVMQIWGSWEIIFKVILDKS